MECQVSLNGTERAQAIKQLTLFDKSTTFVDELNSKACKQQAIADDHYYFEYLPFTKYFCRQELTSIDLTLHCHIVQPRRSPPFSP